MTLPAFYIGPTTVKEAVAGLLEGVGVGANVATINADRATDTGLVAPIAAAIEVASKAMDRLHPPQWPQAVRIDVLPGPSWGHGRVRRSRYTLEIRALVRSSGHTLGKATVKQGAAVRAGLLLAAACEAVESGILSASAGGVDARVYDIQLASGDAHDHPDPTDVGYARAVRTYTIHQETRNNV